MIHHISGLLPLVKVCKEQGALAEVTVGYRSIVALDLVVAPLGPPPRAPASLRGNKTYLPDITQGFTTWTTNKDTLATASLE